jgi:hypothetical protein
MILSYGRACLEIEIIRIMNMNKIIKVTVIIKIKINHIK